MVVLSKTDGEANEGDPYLVVSASTDGVIRIWDVRMSNKERSHPLTEAKTKSRLTCLAGSSCKCEYDLWLYICDIFSYPIFPSLVETRIPNAYGFIVSI